MINKKLVIGTVQFGLPYGINNTQGIPSDNEIRDIFSIASANAIDMLDTASAYGNAENRIGQLAPFRFKIVTKFLKTTKKEDFYNGLNNSLQSLNAECLYGYLAHNAENLIDEPHLWDLLKEKQQQRVIEKVGYSLYNPEQLEKLLSMGMIPDLVQIPFSLFDRKFEPYLNELQQCGCETHVRSVFLQGLYLMPIQKIPEKLASLIEPLILLKGICDRYSIDVVSLALNFAVLNTHIDKVVIGVDSSQQLRRNIEVVNNWQKNDAIIEEVRSIKITDLTILNPANW